MDNAHLPENRADEVARPARRETGSEGAGPIAIAGGGRMSVESDRTNN
jgi:hypothetical protein